MLIQVELGDEELDRQIKIGESPIYSVSSFEHAGGGKKFNKRTNFQRIKQEEAQSKYTMELLDLIQQLLNQNKFAEASDAWKEAGKERCSFL